MAHPSARARPVQLHVIHDLGGGSAKWLADYCKADTERTNLVLRPFAHDVSMASGVALYAGAADETPLRVWKFSSPIYATVTVHAEYRAALDEVIRSRGVGAVLVSSVIGHSLEALDTGLPTVVVNHDYFPWCPAINLYYDGVCARCDGERIAQCHDGNPRYNPFVDFTPVERLEVRDRFVELVARAHVTLVGPSASVERNLKRLDPRFEAARFAVVPHGYGDPLPRVDLAAMLPGERLRVLVLGQLSAAKGMDLLDAALPRIAPFADVYLVGCRELGERYKFERHVNVVSHYEMSELPGHVASIRPHVGLLMSVVSETFGYALSELHMMGVPVAATRVGSFPERIVHGETGYLYEPDVSALVATLRSIGADREGLARVRANLASYRHRTPEEMVADYHRLVPLDSPGAAPPEPTPAVAAAALEAATLAGMWKHIKALNLQLAIVNDARQRTEMHRLADADTRRKLDERLQAFGREIAAREALLLQRDMQLENLSSQLRFLNDTVKAMQASTSWRVSAPIRFVGRRMPFFRMLRRLVARMLREPSTIKARTRELGSAWRSGGFRGVERAVEDIDAVEQAANAWVGYRDKFARDVRPQLVARLGTFSRRPVISVVVPVYNPDKDMFRQMLESVRAQIYPFWELCLADDGSREPHVQATMREFAGADRRIKVDFALENKGVSHASNRALAMATGEYVVLLDHDDILEEHALLRFAESILEDDPDMVYSDEALVTHDKDTVIRYAYRPAFSPEYLRSHPYIVHLVGFRAELLRAVGGWDEALAISQDYDLILRVSEKAKRIVHIPEILYRWRIHGSSAGLGKQAHVMETSKAVLRRHLERIGEAGTVEDGTSFNLFEVRYPLREGLKVAIIIPTKNHGDLLRQCIESIHATAAGAHYDIVVVDHESDDPATVAYLASIAGQAQVLRYEGPFNFSAINNWAVAHLEGEYTHYLLCNNDIEAYEPGWLERMLELGQHPDVGIVGAQLFYPDRKTIQHAGVCIGMFGAAEHYAKGLRPPEEEVESGFGELLKLTREVAAVTAACLLIRKETFAAIEGFDEAIAVGFGDVDLCLRAGAAGYRVVYCPHARLMHHESFTRGVSDIDPHPGDSSLYRVKWKEMLEAGDPFYSPALSLRSTKWAIRLPIPCSADVRRRITTIDHARAASRISFSAKPAAHGE